MLTMFPLKCRNGMGARRDRAHHTKWRVFLQRNAMIAAAGVGTQPIHARHELDDFELLDFVVQPSNFGFIELDAAPLFGVFVRQGFDNFLNFAARRRCLYPAIAGMLPAPPTQASLASLEHPELAAQRRSGGTVLAVSCNPQFSAGAVWMPDFGVARLHCGCGFRHWMCRHRAGPAPPPRCRGPKLR